MLTENPTTRQTFTSVFGGFFQFAGFISAPFVVPYWLAQLKMNYYDYMIAISSLYRGKIVATWFVEKYRWNPRKKFPTGCLVISPLPALTRAFSVSSFSTSYSVVTFPSACPDKYIYYRECPRMAVFGERYTN